MTDHKMPAGIKRVKPGEYTFGPAHTIRQDAESKLWTVGGDGTESLKPFKSRGQAVTALRELGVVPAEQPVEAEETTKHEHRDEQPEAAKAVEPGPTEAKPPTTRSKPRTGKEAAKTARPVGKAKETAQASA